jgi:hypothetical protein
VAEGGQREAWVERGVEPFFLVELRSNAMGAMRMRTNEELSKRIFCPGFPAIRGKYVSGLF